MSTEAGSDFETARAAIRRALTRPTNTWFVLDLGHKYASYISDDGSGVQIVFVIGLNTSEYFVTIGTPTGESFLTAEFQIDQGAIWPVTDCFIGGCDQRIPRREDIFARLRLGNQLRFGGEITNPPRRDFRNVPLLGIGNVLDNL